MTVEELFEYVDEIVENQYSDEVKMIWLNQIEAEIQVDVLLMAVEGIIQYDENTYNATMLAPAPYDQLYQEYLFWRICLAQQEFELADGYAATFNRAYNEYVRFICETVNPGTGTAEKLRYYLTAYQIAVKHGHTGTEEEWLLSLKGPEGEPGTGLNILGQVATEAGLPGPDGLAPGTGYLVGSGTNALLYIWDGTDWFYKTQLSGKGEKGDTGAQGPAGPKGDTGATGPQGEKGNTGEKGEPGVYYGTEAPTDPNHPIWINPMGTPISGLFFSKTLTNIEVIDRADYEALPTPRPSTTAYLIKG